jgi:hypothetical protein
MNSTIAQGLGRERTTATFIEKRSLLWKLSEDRKAYFPLPGIPEESRLMLLPNDRPPEYVACRRHALTATYQPVNGRLDQSLFTGRLNVYAFRLS